MGKKLTQAQIERYHRDGFVYPINALAAEEARRHRRAMEEFEAAQGRELTKGHNFKPHLLCVAVDEAGRDDPMARVDLLAPARVNGADARDAISAPW